MRNSLVVSVRVTLLRFLKSRVYFIASFRLCVFALTSSAFSADTLASLTVPDGFEVTLAATSELIPYGMCMAFDEQGRLYVTESSAKNLTGEEMAKNPECRVRRLEDRDGDGVYDESKIFAEKLSLPMGALWHQGALYVATPPDFVRLDDKDGDGVSESREVILTGWNVKNTASLHGPFMGPDGMMYLTHGRHGYKIKTKEGETLEGLAPRIWRCRLDGTQLERVCGGGFDNPVELVFNPSGEMFLTMTYFTDPMNGQRDALLHLAEGGVYSKPHECVAEFKRTGDFMPVMTKFARIAPAGLAMYRSSSWGEEYRGNLFSAQFNPHRVQRHVIRREGATFATEDSDFLVSSDPDFHPTDVIEDADGSLLVLDTGGWYVDACPLSKIQKPDARGGIYRIRKRLAAQPDDSWGMLDEPRGTSVRSHSRNMGIVKAPPGSLTALLSSDHPMVRDRALDHLVEELGELAIPALANAVGNGKTSEARCMAVWGLCRIGTPDALRRLRGAANHGDPAVRVAIARAMGMTKDPKAIRALRKMLSAREPEIRREAAAALGRIGDPTVSRALLQAAARADDRFTEHAIIYALIVLNDAPSARASLSDSDPRTRKTALIALDQMDSGNLLREDVGPLLRDRDSLVKRAALDSASRRNWTDEISDSIRDMLMAENLSEESAQSLKESLLAISKSEAGKELTATLALDPSLDPKRIPMLLDVMDQSPTKEFPPSWKEVLGKQVENAPRAPESGEKAIAILRSRGIADHDATLEKLAHGTDVSNTLRIAALGAIVPRKPKLNDSSFKFALARISPEGDPTLRMKCAEILGKSHLSETQLIELAESGVARADAIALPPLLEAFGRSTDAAAGGALVAALKQSKANLNLLGGGRLEKLLQNFPARVHDEARPLLDRIREEEAAKLEKLAAFEPLLSGGDVGRGRRIFFEKKAACSGCHAIGEEGGRLGPDLTSIGAIRSGRDLLEAILFPSASFVPGYEPFRIETASDVEAGVIGEQTSDAILLKTGADAQIRIPRETILSMQPSTVSTMPDGIDAGLSQEEFVDLLAFLQAQNGEQWLLAGKRAQKAIPLFNGKDLTGLYVYLDGTENAKRTDKNFTIENGMLRVSGKTKSYLSTKAETWNYRLVVEYSLSGAAIASDKKQNQEVARLLFNIQGTDAIWPKSVSLMPAEIKEIEKPSGEWNALEIVSDDGIVKVTLNGKTIMDKTGVEPQEGRIAIPSGGQELLVRRMDLFPLR